MTKVFAEVETLEIEIEPDVVVECTAMTCSRCGLETRSPGASERSIAECSKQLQQICPKKEQNFYTPETFRSPDPPAEFLCFLDRTFPGWRTPIMTALKRGR